MCQIHIINKATYDAEPRLISSHLESGSIMNNHGCSALFINADGEHTLMRGMDFDAISGFMAVYDEWETVVIHQRYTTQGKANINNTHLWQVGDFFYCHNGVMRARESNQYPVDSQLIGNFLEDGNVWDAIAYCQSEDYANVFIINLEMKSIWISRSISHTLYTDGRGQYSTDKLPGIIEIPVPQGSVQSIDLDITTYCKYQDTSYYDGWDKWNSYDPDALTYDEKCKQSKHGTETEQSIETSKAIVEANQLSDEEYEAELEEDHDSDSKYSTLSEEYYTKEELEQLIYQAQADSDEQLENRYTYLLDRKEGNG